MKSLIDGLKDAMAYDQRGEIAAARQCLDAIDTLVPDEAPYQKLVGLMYQRLGADAKSIVHLTRAAELDPDDPETQMGIGHHWTDNARQEEAIAAYSRAADLDPANAEPYLQRGRCQGYLGAFAAAERDFQAAAERAPERIEPLLHQGAVRLDMGRPSEAQAAFEYARSLAPDNLLAEVGRRRSAHLAAAGPIPARGTSGEPATVICLKHGTKYGPDYVNTLYSMVTRNTDFTPRFVCFTENAGGLDARIEVLRLPADNLEGWWNKVALFKRDLGIHGRLLYLDLDVVVTGPLDPLLRYESSFAIMNNDYVPGFNTSVMLFESGGVAHLWEEFSAADAGRMGGDQDWVSLEMPGADLWPRDWCVPFRLRAVDAPPPDTRVVAFSGEPNPADHPAPWVTELWR